MSEGAKAAGAPTGSVAWALYAVASAAAMFAGGLMLRFLDWGNRLLETAEVPPDRLNFPDFNSAVVAIVIATAGYVAATRFRTPARLVIVVFPPLAYGLGHIWLFAARMVDQIANIGVFDDDDTFLQILVMFLFLPPTIIVWGFGFGKYAAGTRLADVRVKSANILLWLLLAAGTTCAVATALSAAAVTTWPSYLGNGCLSLLWLYHIWCLLVGRARYFAERRPQRQNHFAPLI